MGKDTIIKCKFCDEKMRFADWPKHGWDKHKTQMEEQRRKGTAASHKPKGEPTKEKEVEPSKLKVHFVTESAVTDARLLLLYDAFMHRFPDSGIGIGDFLFFCTTRYAAEHAEELGLPERTKELMEV